MTPHAAQTPSWDRLFEAAVAQDGYFTTKEAAEAGYSPQLLQKYLKNGRITRVRRGVYRIVHYPAADHEDLVALWLWSDKAGVFSHETALMLHDLSDALPSKIHMTLPADWVTRRLRVPKGVRVHYGDVDKNDRTELGPVPLTSVRRTLFDCADAHVSLEFIDAALRQARSRKLIERDTERAVRARARPLCRTDRMIRYTTAAAFKQALETRLRTASSNGLDFARRPSPSLRAPSKRS